ncbi:MAG TPA: NAD(P)-dependent alcohol dehydrogenase [Xanthobacteraceae bacterium]|nr:NAD(P)-dependent alcohol dehydrogenase [Xanthobacteraceae bacterium]
MKVIELRDDWSLENVVPGTRPDPKPGPGQIVVKMEAASLNYRDFVMVRRGYGRHTGALPLIVLSDGAGRVIETGKDVTRVGVGDLVCPLFAQTWFGGALTEAHRAHMLAGPLDGVMQEYMCLSEEAVVKAPAHFSAAEAATLPCAALTAWHAVIENGAKPGDLVVTQGTGGVSLFALQFAKLAGATVAITSSSDDKLARVQKLGADIRINYRTHPEWYRELRRHAGGRGADLVVELGGEQSLDQSLRAVRVSGTVALIGVLSGGTAPLNLGRVVTQNLRLQGVTIGNRAMFEAMVRAIEKHRLAPVIDEHRFAFGETRAAIATIAEGKHFGKIAVEF